MVKIRNNFNTGNEYILLLDLVTVIRILSIH
jgi:hypothetical protein